MGALLIACGLVLAAVGTWSGYRSAREAMLPLLREGEPTRAAIDASRPVHERAGLRQTVRSIVAAVAWLVLALYGLYLASAGSVVGGPG